MQIELSAEDAAFVREFAARHGGEEKDALALAIRLLRRQDAEQAQALADLSSEELDRLAEIMREAEASRGQGRTYEATPELLQEIRREGLARAAQRRARGA